jgi:putative DNA primase/helicase
MHDTTTVHDRLPPGWTREDWDWVHAAPDSDRWEDAPVLLAYPPPPPPGQHDAHVEAWCRAKNSDAADDLFLDPSDPIRTARALLDAKYKQWDDQTCHESGRLHRHRGAFWCWSGDHYQLIDDETMRATLWTFMEPALRWEKYKDKETGNEEWREVPFKPTNGRVSDALAALNAVTQLDQYVEAPAWLTVGTTDADRRLHTPNGRILILPPADELMACGNGLLHLPTGELYIPSPDYFNVSASTVRFDAEAPPPTQWLAFLEQVFDDDAEAIQLLQEWFGYLLSLDTTQQKILLAVGPKRSGKGTIGRILTAMLGKDSVGAPTMSNLAETFGLESLITKSLAIISDARIGARTDKSAIVERLLSISGEDSLTVPRKYMSAWTGRLPTRFIILTNELPSLTDGSGALAGRFIILVMTKSFFGKEDPALTNKLLTELPGILNWSIEGYRRLRQRGYFVQPKSSLAAAEDIEMLAAPVKAFVRDCCLVAPGLRYITDNTWEDWKVWSEDQGLNAGSKAWFGRNLQSAVPGLTVIRERDKHGNRVQAYVGIAVKSEPLAPEVQHNTQKAVNDAREALRRAVDAHNKAVRDP